MSGSARSGPAAGPGAGPSGIDGPAGRCCGWSWAGAGLIVEAFSGCVSIRASGCAVGAALWLANACYDRTRVCCYLAKAVSRHQAPAPRASLSSNEASLVGIHSSSVVGY